MSRGFLLLLVLAAACSEDLTSPDVRVELITPGGGSPTAGVDQLTVQVREGEADPEQFTAKVSGGSFELPVVTGGGILDVRVRLSGASVDLIGAPPPFFILEATTGGGAFLVRIPVGRPRSCEVLRFRGDSSATLPLAATDVGLSQHGSFVVVAGGVAEAGPTNQIGWLDLLQLTRGDYEADLSRAPGPVRGVGLTGPSMAGRVPTPFALGLAESPFVLDIEARDGGLRDAGLPEGVGFESALIDLPTGGAFVVGGGASTSNAFALVDAEGSVTARALVAPRRAPAAALLARHVLVVGGAAEDDPFAEVHAVSGEDAPITLEYDDGVREGGWLVASSDGAQALLGGGLDEAGALRTDTVWFQGCPSDCKLEAGPAWTARAGSRVQPAPGGGAWIVGGEESRVVERVRFGPEAPPAIESFAELAEPRADASLLVVDSGILYVAGGRSSAGPSASVEICFPDVLR